MEILLIAALIGIIPAAVASSKGHSFLAWYLFGAALFIVALPCALLLRPDQATLDRRQLSDGGRRCPKCAEIVRREAVVCRYCGASLEGAPVS